MACASCDKKGFNHQEIQQGCKESLYKTSVFLCGFQDFDSEIHGAICRWLQFGIQRKKRHFLLMVPRSFFKTSLASAFCIWRLINNPERRIFYFHDSATMSSKTLRKIQGILQSPLFQHFFGELLPSAKDTDKRWNREEIELTRKTAHSEASIWARGVDSSVTGGHCDDMVLDDLVGEDSHRSSLEVQRRIEFVKYSSFLFDNAERGISLVLGTWWPGGFYEYATELDKYEKCVFGAYVDQRYIDFIESAGMKTEKQIGDPTFPQRRSKSGLEEERRQSGDYSFTHQMLNLPVQDDMIQFRSEDIMYFRWADGGDSIIAGEDKIPLHALFKTLTVDPATGESLETDDSAITVCGYEHKTGRIFVLETASGKWLPKVLCQKIVEMHKKWKPARAGIEDASGFKVLKHFVPHEMASQSHFFTITPLKPGSRSKWERIISALQPFVASRQIWLPYGRQSKLQDEMINFRVMKGTLVGRSPNVLDSLAYHAEFWKLGKTIDKPMDEIPRYDPKKRIGYAARCET